MPGYKSGCADCLGVADGAGFMDQGAVNNTVQKTAPKNYLNRFAFLIYLHTRPQFGFPGKEGHAFACFVIDGCAWVWWISRDDGKNTRQLTMRLS